MKPNPVVDVPLFGEVITKDGVATERFQTLLETIAQVINSAQLPEYTMATVPDASKNKSMQIVVSDASIGATTAVSDGVNWYMFTPVILS